MQLTGHLAYLLYAASLTLALPFEKRSGTSYSGGTTANDIENGVCAAVSFIFARGSTETGNMGESVGPALAKKLISTLGADKMAIQGVTYTASIASNIERGSGGGPVMKQLADKALSACPNTKIVLSGYSQGAMVVHYAVKTSGLSPDDVAAVVLYGDPEDRTSVGSLPSSKLKEFCATGDGVCETGGFDITAAHLSYTTDGDIASGEEFIVGLLGDTSTSSSDTSTSSTDTSASGGDTSTSGGSSSYFPSIASSAGDATSSPTSLFGSFFKRGLYGPSNTTGPAPTASSTGSSGLLGKLLSGLESSLESTLKADLSGLESTLKTDLEKDLKTELESVLGGSSDTASGSYAPTSASSDHESLKARGITGPEGSLPTGLGSLGGGDSGSNPLSSLGGGASGSNPLSSLGGGDSGSNPLSSLGGSGSGSNPLSSLGGSGSGSNPLSNLGGGDSGSSNPLSSYGGSSSDSSDSSNPLSKLSSLGKGGDSDSSNPLSKLSSLGQGGDSDSTNPLSKLSSLGKGGAGGLPKLGGEGSAI